MAYKYSYATEEDGEEISRLLENIEFEGEISIAYCRRPNAVLSLLQEGDKSTFIIAKDDENKIVGVGGCVIRGRIAYLTGLRAVNLLNLPKCYDLMHKYCIENGAKITYTTILESNIYAQKMLEKKRPKMPLYIKHSNCVVNIIKKNLNIKDKNTLVKKENDFILYDTNNNQIASGKIEEQWHYKQYVIKKYSAKLKFLKIFLRWLPNENQVLKFFILKEVNAKDSVALESFLRHMSRIKHEGRFFLYGGTDCPIKSLKYKSIVYIVDWDKSITDAKDIQLNIEIADL